MIACRESTIAWVDMDRTSVSSWFFTVGTGELRSPCAKRRRRSAHCLIGIATSLDTLRDMSAANIIEIKMIVTLKIMLFLASLDNSVILLAAASALESMIVDRFANDLS